MVTSDLEATRSRHECLADYFRDKVMSGGVLRCRHADRCGAEACRVGADFYAGQLSYLGPHYDLIQSGEALRVLIVPMEVGAGPAYVSMERRSEGVQAVRYGTRNPHMQGVVFALQLAFGLPLSDRRANEHLDSNHGRIHVLDAFAMANLRLCSLAGPGKTSKATSIVSENCFEHLAETIRILEPTLVISQGNTLHPTLSRHFTLDHEYSEHVFRASLKGHQFIWAWFYHPTRWWDRRGRPYLRVTVEPEIKRARCLAVHCSA
jgi:hypothetical protein